MPRILVVGAGPTGLTAALELRRLGLEAEIIERRKEASNLSRAVGILPSTMRILGPSGAAEAIGAEAIHFTHMIMHRGAREVARLPVDVGPSVLGLAQDRTEAHLIEALGRYGGEVRYGCAFEGLAQDGDGVTVTVNGGEERFDYVIGADGVGSAVRGALGLAYDGFDLAGEWSIADVESDDWPDPTAGKIFWLDHGQIVVVVPLEKTRFRVVASQPDALAALPVPIHARVVRRTATFRISVRQVDQYRVGRVFLAGDAAHCHSPAGGRGMNLGIADAADLARRFAEDELGGYHAARHAAGAEAIRVSERMRRTMMAEHDGVRSAVAAFVRLAARVPFLRRQLLKRIIPADG